MKTVLVIAAMSCLAGVAVARAPNRAGSPSDQEISDSSIYLFRTVEGMDE